MSVYEYAISLVSVLIFVGGLIFAMIIWGASK